MTDTDLIAQRCSYVAGHWINGDEALAATLSAVTAVVVGVVLNLAVWFGGHVLFPVRPR